MKSRSKTNNIVAVIIAIFLFAAGFAMSFIHQQTESPKKSRAVEKPAVTEPAAVQE